MAHQSVFRWRYDRPLSLEQFQLRFPDDYACAAYLEKKRSWSAFSPPHSQTHGFDRSFQPFVDPQCGQTKPSGHAGISEVRRWVSVENESSNKGKHQTGAVCKFPFMKLESAITCKP